MYNYAGLVYRIWGVSGILLLLGMVCVLLEKPWIRGFNIRDCKVGVVIIAFSVCLSLVYLSRIISPNISSHTGVFVDYQRNSRVAPPLPVTYEYVFTNSEEKKKVFYLDSFSKSKIYPSEFESGQEYTIYYDRLTKIIVKVQNLK